MFVIPSIFTAVDKFSSPLKGMGSAVTSFSNKADAAVARSERLFRKLTPALSETTKQMFSMVSAAAIAGAVIGGISFSVTSVKDYEKAVASFRTIVGGSDKEFMPFQQMINNVAKDTKKSSIDVAAAFEKIAGLNADFAKTPEAIGAVSRAVITLSKASGDELGPSAESLIGIMNQFGFAANQADRTINVLAAGAGVGAASIVQTSEAFVNFGSVAKGANISLEQSVGLIQTLGKFSVFGAEAGTKLRGSILKLQQAGLGYKSGQFQINDALEEAKKKVDKLKTAKLQDAAVLKMFGAENIATGKILLNNVDLFDKYTKGVTGTSEATKQAEIRSNTLEEKLNELKAGWINMLTGSKGAGKGLESVKKIIGFVADNLDQIVSIGSKVLIFFAAWKAAMIASKIVMIAYRAVSSALFLVDMIKYTASTTGLTFAQSAYAIAMQSSTGAQLSLNAAMAANPIGIVVIALVALAAAVYAVYSAYKELEAIAKKEAEKKKAIKDESFAVQDLEKKYLALGKTKAEAQSMAIADSKKGIIAGLDEAKTMLASPLDEVRAKGMEKLNVLQGRAQAISKPGDAFNFAGNRFANSEDLKTKALTLNPQPSAGNVPQFDWLNNQPGKKLVNPEGAKQDAMVQKLENTNNAKVEITLNDPSGKAEASSDNKHVTIKTTSTIQLNSAK